jgi:sugar lactone lactonase YvrE
MQSVQAEVVFSHPSELAEGALWDVKSARLYWVDILAKHLMVFEPRVRSNQRYLLSQSPGSVVVCTSGQLLLALRSGFGRFDPARQALVMLVDPESDKPGNRFNDGKCDPQGRFWAGSIVEDGQAGNAALYCLRHDLSVTRHLSQLTNSNGLVWSSDGGTFFHIDTPSHQVRAFAFEPVSGTLHSPRVVYEFEPAGGAPDGMTIDAEDHLWVALWGGGRVVRLDPRTGQVVFEVRVAATNVTSCALGGPELNDLFITTARVGLRAEQLQREPQAGSLFQARVPFRGVPAVRFAG